ncbi:UNVERIFIED_CONTAM: Ureide permease 2 [Sesamum angustifolium]|uniref:Ureide permease 2 n=1 Tax=Sesamum angustifolium TaxID=2727405 RepID=A0AAW2RM95_9LAMI
MYVIESKGAAIICMLLALVFLGTWPAILAHLERRGRLPQHTYLDYSLTNFLTAVAIALTVGQIGDGKVNMPNFITQLSQDNWPCVLMAMVGGVFLSLGNLSTQYAWAFVGLSVTEVITSSIAVVLGTTLNYFLDDRINRAEILFPGVGCFLVAVFLGSAVHSSNAADITAKLSSLSDSCKDSSAADGASDYREIVSSKDSNMEVTEEKVRVGSADYLIELEHNRAIKVFGKSIWLGLSITFFAGVCYSLFSPTFNLATNNQWHMMKRGVPDLVVYTAFFYFSLSFFFIALVLNVWFLYHPVLNLPKSSITSYLKDWKGRNWAVLAGICCGIGQWPAVHGRASCRLCGSRLRSGSSTCEHILGYTMFWGVQEILEEDLYFASKHAAYVCCGSSGAYCFIRASKNLAITQKFPYNISGTWPSKPLVAAEAASADVQVTKPNPRLSRSRSKTILAATRKEAVVLKFVLKLKVRS